jgi:hypothetical protein
MSDCWGDERKNEVGERKEERKSTRAAVLPPATRRARTVLPMMAYRPGFWK